MRGFRAAALAALATTVAADVPAIVIKGSKFFYDNNGTQFFMKGVAYQQEYSGSAGTGTTSNNTNYKDPLSDEAACKRDIPYLQQLQTNTIRVYAVDPTANHDACMNALAAAGIYVVADLSAPIAGGSINRDSPTWDDALYARYTAVIDKLAKYNNTLGFFAGNEVSNMPNNTNAAAFVKAAVRDTKRYIKSQNYRAIGVGYATSDDQYIRDNIGTFMNCGDQASAIDFLGYNIYSWCGTSSYTKSGYDQRTKQFSAYSVPVFFAEYGCIDPRPRTFEDVGTLYGSEMTPVWSGGIVYMYFEESNNYGLVTVSGNSVTTNDDFDNLSSQIAKISPTGVNRDSYTPSNSPAACPSTASDWGSVATPLPPSPNQELCSCMYNSLSCVVAPNVDTTGYGDLFGYVCAQSGVCDGIQHNSTTGKYGAYGMCNSTEQLAYVLNAYYKKQGSSSSACAFSGSATLKSAVTPTGQCASLVSAVGTAGTGTPPAPSGTGAGAAAGGGSGSGAASSSHAGAGIVGVPSVQTGVFPVVVMGTIGLISGLGMILL